MFNPNMHTPARNLTRDETPPPPPYDSTLEYLPQSSGRDTGSREQHAHYHAYRRALSQTGVRNKFQR